MEPNPTEPEKLPKTSVARADASRRTVLAAERTWLAWFRSGIGVAAAAIGVGGVVPKLTDSTSWGYVALGAGFAALAVGVFVEG